MIKTICKQHRRSWLIAVCCVLSFTATRAQTDLDAIMMTKNNFCGGAMYSYSSWQKYWEGTYKRDNQNLGTVSTKMLGIMGNYGISNKLNVLVSAPYIQTKASSGTLHGMKGIQDLAVWLKWMPVEKTIGKSVFSLYGIGGFALPLSNYIADFLPLSIGLHNKSISGRLMADFQRGDFFVTASGTYTYRSNIHIDRTAYYSTELQLTDEIEMPDVASFNFRTGYRSDRLIAEVILSNSSTLGGFDIRKNDMPFPSNKMNATAAGVNMKYSIKTVPGLSFIAGGNYVIAGRNVGGATTVNGGVFYIINFSHTPKEN